jgi:flagellar motor component MotA
LYVQFGLEHPETYRLIFMERYTKAVFEGKQQSSAGNQALQFLIDAFEQLRAQGRLAADATSAQLADTFWCAVHGIVSLKLTCDEYPETPTDELVHTMQAALIRGILK